MNRITGFTDPDFEEEYESDETAIWQKDLSGRGDLKEVPSYILKLIVVGVVTLFVAAWLFLKLT